MSVTGLKKKNMMLKNVSKEDSTYSAPLKATLRLVAYDNEEEQTKQILSAKEQEVYMGDLPLMTQEDICCRMGLRE